MGAVISFPTSWLALVESRETLGRVSNGRTERHLPDAASRTVRRRTPHRSERATGCRPSRLREEERPDYGQPTPKKTYHPGGYFYGEGEAVERADVKAGDVLRGLARVAFGGRPAARR